MEIINSRQLDEEQMNKSKRKVYRLVFSKEQNPAYKESATVTFRPSTEPGMIWLTTALGSRNRVTTIVAREYWNTCIANGWKVAK